MLDELVNYDLLLHIVPASETVNLSQYCGQGCVQKGYPGWNRPILQTWQATQSATQLSLSLIGEQSSKRRDLNSKQMFEQYYWMNTSHYPVTHLSLPKIVQTHPWWCQICGSSLQILILSSVSTPNKHAAGITQASPCARKQLYLTVSVTQIGQHLCLRVRKSKY